MTEQINQSECQHIYGFGCIYDDNGFVVDINIVDEFTYKFNFCPICGVRLNED